MHRMTILIAAATLAASTALAEPPPDIAAKLRALGPVIDARASAEIYADVLGRQPKDGVNLRADVAYGPDPLTRLDIYTPSSRPAAAMPVVIYFHGGGFIRGDKADQPNIGYFFARHGVIALMANYRLAPKVTWPAEAQDVVSAVRWAQAHVAELGGDPRRIVLIGESAGAANVALAVVDARLHGGKPLGVAGAVLESGVYDVALEAKAPAQLKIEQPDTRNPPYFGKDVSRYGAMSTVRLISDVSTPILLSYAELDPAQMQVEAGEMFTALCAKATRCPGLMRLSGHGHISQVLSYNTDDTSVSDPVLAFVLAH